MKFYAHTKADEPQENWEPLFTPFGEGEEECQDTSCEKCRHLEPMHGHLNKVAYWAGKFAAEMFPPGSPESDAARDFKLIDDYSEPVLIPFGKKGRALCDKLRETFDPVGIRHLIRKLQRYIVNIPKSQHAELFRAGILLPLHESRFFLPHSDIHYSHNFGLHPHPEISPPPSNLVS